MTALHIQRFDEHREADGVQIHMVTDPDGNRVRVVPDERLPSPSVLGGDWRAYSVEEPDASAFSRAGDTRWRVPRAVWNLAVCGFGMAPGIVHCQQCSKPIETGGLVDWAVKNAHADRLCYSCRGNPVPESRSVGHKSAVIAGTIYEIADTRPKGNREFLGFGGSRHDILFNDGHRVTTWNLWHRGVIERFARGSLPDNAIFLIPEDEIGKRKVRRYVRPHRSDGESKRATRWRVECPEHGFVYLTEGEAAIQRHDSIRHHCPRCGKRAPIDHVRARWMSLTLRQQATELYEQLAERKPELRPSHLARVAFLRATGRCLRCRSVIQDDPTVPCECGAIICPNCGRGDMCWCPPTDDGEY